MVQIQYGTYIPTAYVLNYSCPSWIPPVIYFSAVGEPALIISQEVFLEAKARWEHTCIAGGIIVWAYKKRKFNFLELPLTLLIFFRIYLFAPCLFTTMRAFQASCCMHMHCNKICSNSRYKSIRTIFAFIISYGSFTLAHYIHTNN